MSSIKGTNVTAPIVPFDTSDIFASHLAKYGQGGWRTVDNLNERDSIVELRREDLMVCAVKDDSYDNSTRGMAFYILDVNHENSTSSLLTDNNNWTLLEFGSGDGWVFPPPIKSFTTGIKGQRSFDDDFLYICILDNVWKRMAFDFFDDAFEFTSGTGSFLNGVVPIWTTNPNEWSYDYVVKSVVEVEGTSGASNYMVITYTDDSVDYISIGGSGSGGDNWITPAPISSATFGVKGQRSYDTDFLYVCVEDNLWKRINLDIFTFNPSSSGNVGFAFPNGSVPIWDSALKLFKYENVLQDVNTTYTNGTNYVNVTYSNNNTISHEIVISGLNDLNSISDVVVPTPQVNDTLSYDGTNWVNKVLASSNDYTTAGLASVSYVNTTFTTKTDFNNATSGINTSINNLQNQVNNLDLNDLLDTTIASPILDDSLVYDGTNWVNKSLNITDYTTAGLASTSWVEQNFINETIYSDDLNLLNSNINNLQNQINNTNLADLSDTVITTPVLNEALIYDGTNWINKALAINNDYTTAGLASNVYVDTTFTTKTDFNTTTNTINQRLDDLSSIDSLKTPDVFTPSGSYPTTYYSNPIKQGDTWRITTDGIMGGISVNSEDLLISLSDLPAQVDSNFMVIESNRDQATEAIKGVAKIASSIEAFNGLDDSSFITPLKLQQKVNTLSDYTTAGLASISYVDTTFTTKTDFNNATNGINTNINNLQNQVDNLVLNDLTDININSVILDDALIYDGTNWINKQLNITDHTTAGYLTVYNDYTTAGLASLDYVNSKYIYTALSDKIYTILSGLSATTNANLFPDSVNDLGSTTINANQLSVGDSLKISLSGYFTLQNASQFNARVKFGSIVLATNNSINIASLRTNSLIKCEFIFTIRSIGSSGTCVGQGYIDISSGAVSNALRIDLVNNGEVTIDTTINNEIRVELDWDINFQGIIGITNAKIEK